jgi:hypothetical protein
VTLDYSIDRADFRSLVDTALGRIPTASRGQWTLHAPVDPGITLIELFAWLLEQRSYLADRTTAPMVRAVLALLGATMRQARAAGCALSFEPDDHVAVGRRAPYRVAETDIVFTLQHGVFALALERYPSGPAIIELEGVAGYGAEDVRGGRPVPLLAAHGGASEARIGLRIAKPLPATVNERVAILFELDTSVQPEWSPDASAAEPPAELRWEYKSTGGGFRPLPQLCDGTLGLRRSGVVRFALPADWEVAPIAWLRVATERATFSAPPAVVRIVPNSALATHTRWAYYAEAQDWLPLPGRMVQLPPDALPLPSQLFVRLHEHDRTRRWRAVCDFMSHGPADSVFTIDRTRAQLTFGDGLNGRVPRLASPASRVLAWYATGGGRAGNVPPRTWQAVAQRAWEPAPVIPEARSVISAVGGREAESLDEARGRAAARLRRPTRAVTPADHEALARSTPGVEVARAHAEPGLLLGECGVVPGVTTVFIVPGSASRTRDQVRDHGAVAAPVADPGMLREVRLRLANARLAGESIFVEPAMYRKARVRATVAGAPYDPAALRARLSAALRVFLDPLLGGEQGSGWTFGAPVRSTALLAVAQREVGDRGEVTAIDVSLDGGPFKRCQELPIRPYELIAVDGVEVLLDRQNPGAEVGLR